MTVTTNPQLTAVGASSVGGVSPVSVRKVVLSAVAAADASFTLPANAYIMAIKVKNNTANAITGGLKFGTTAGGIDIVVAQAIGASANLCLLDAVILLKTWAAAQIIYIDAVAAWNSATADITIVYGQL